jgi:hypothetical protein
MKSRIFALVLLPALFLSSGAYLQETTPSDELAAGIRQFDEGDLEAAVVSLDTAVQRLRGEGSQRKDLARAHLYLAMAKLGLSQPDAARRDMGEALRADATLTLDAKLYPPRVLQLYEETRKEVVGEAGAIPQASGPEEARPTAGASPSGRKSGSGKTILIAGVGAALAGVAVAAAGGGSPASGEALSINLNVGPEGVQRCNTGISIFGTATNPTGTAATINTATLERRVTSGECVFGFQSPFTESILGFVQRTIPARARDFTFVDLGVSGSCMGLLCAPTECRAQVDLTLETSLGTVRASDTYTVGYPGNPACLSGCTAGQMQCTNILPIR